jgi:hypothetical protein
MKALVVVLLTAILATAQSKREPAQQIQIPSQAEMNELLSKTVQKVTAFQDAVNTAKPMLDKIDPKLSVNYLDAAATAQLMAKSMQQNGASAYGLVGLLSTLDDLSLDTADASVLLLKADEEQTLKGHPPDVTRLALVLQFQNVQNGTNDISELLMHSTLRLIQAEEAVLDKLTSGSK